MLSNRKQLRIKIAQWLNYIAFQARHSKHNKKHLQQVNALLSRSNEFKKQPVRFQIAKQVSANTCQTCIAKKIPNMRGFEIRSPTQCSLEKE